jgi:hypothetical protein
MTWHPYLEERPEKEGEYLVQMPDGEYYFGTWMGGDEWWLPYPLRAGVVAWTPLPPPYVKEG